MRRGDSIVAVVFLDISVDSVAPLAWYRVIDLEQPGDTLDYAFLAIRFHAVPLFFDRPDDDSAYTPQERERLLRPLHALVYAVRLETKPWFNLDAGEMHRTHDDHAMTFSEKPAIGDAMSLLRRWHSPHIRPLDPEVEASDFKQPSEGDGVLISQYANATEPHDLRPALVIDGGVCSGVWSTLFGTEPSYRTRPSLGGK
jgi:hypothetical protein